MRDQLGFYDEVASEHGDVTTLEILGIGDFCLVAHPDHFERILVNDRDSFAKTEDFQVAFGDSVLTNEGERWKRQRENLDEFFYPQRIRSYADEMVKFTERRIGRWEEETTVPLRHEMKQLTLENLFGTLFDRPLEIGSNERLRDAADDLNLWFKSTSYALPRWIPTPARRQFRKAVDVLESEAEAMLDERKREGADGDDLLSTLVRLRAENEAALSDDEIVDQIVTLMFAGHDTTAFLLVAALHQLSSTPSVRERFHTELDDVLGDRTPELGDVGDLTVTKNIINETLRRYPSLFTIPRKTTREVNLGGYRVPAETRLHLSVWRVHRDERFWDDPKSWQPTRWQEMSPQDKGYAFVPFGAGPRACLGRRFARLEATLVLSTIGQQYELDPERPLELTPELTTQPAHRVPVHVQTRT
jgi:cytochrome P450